jgi:hypothetical protein
MVYQELTGGLFVLFDHDGMKKSSSATGARLDIPPAGKHDILRNVEPLPFTLADEQVFKGMWQSPEGKRNFYFA